MLAGMFNWKIAIAYVLVGLILAVIGGTIISKLKLEDYVEAFVYKNKMMELEQESLTKKDRLKFSLDQVSDIIKKVWLYIFIGVGIGALIHNVIPGEFIEAVLGQDKWYSVFVATFAGVPMYADIFGALPIAQALVTKNVGIGTALSFMMAVTALSLPSMILLKKVVKPKLLIIFASIVIIGILIIGFTFNALAYLLI